MIEYWYIWYEIFEDGVKLSEGKYPRSYRYKRNAERRARQMWGVDLYSPLTGTTYVRKWTVSQECPWKEEVRS